MTSPRSATITADEHEASTTPAVPLDQVAPPDTAPPRLADTSDVPAEMHASAGS